MRRLDPLRRTPWSAFPTVWLSMGWGRHRLGLSTARVVIGAGYHRSGLSSVWAIVGSGDYRLGSLWTRSTMDSGYRGLGKPRAELTTRRVSSDVHARQHQKRTGRPGICLVSEALACQCIEVLSHASLCCHETELPRYLGRQLILTRINEAVND